ncbi:beta-xylosidase [Christiangramia fulva]|uniref:Beta-xylosidase n=1 Tax=Christiangramia fulva TaxID=2126553 RepID=A0A2R3Z5M9_9FLAO|nr:family 43 glycosylhydrolase [Christiangramia fulva]AVR45586.1 beta-xylosidase [Christiangramia fulva]
MQSSFRIYLFIVSITFLFQSCTASKEIEEKRFQNYLFTYFTGNREGEEAVHYAISPDGYHFYALNNDQPIINTKDISEAGGVRDPHILRAENGMFYMVLTDLKSANGWTNTAMVMLKSKDLIHWESSIVDIPQVFTNKYSDAIRVWAPQTIYDDNTGKYMVYFSMLQPGSYDKIYYAYANKDFTSLEEAPKQLFFNPKEMAAIDGDIIKKEGKFYLFYKTEGSTDKGIKVAISDSLTEGFEPLPGNVDQTDKAVEGSSVFKLIDSDKYILMYDVYMDGEYQFAQSTDLKNFKAIDEEISMNFHPRHGTVIPITNQETEELLKAFPPGQIPWVMTSESSQVKKMNIVKKLKKGNLYLPVKQGTDLANFDPEFKLWPDVTISPEEPQDYTKEAVEYTLHLPDGKKETISVKAEINNNPVLEGYYADPEIIYSHKDGKYYLYPTSDGFTGWSGTYFKTFSSKDLVNWSDEGVILDLKKEVSWADRHAWAPTIAEKKVNGKYLYYYYFTAAQKIGVAVSDDPAGHFIDSGEPLVSEKPEGVQGGQNIDPDVFTDPKSGKSYLYWGNGFMAVAELNEDMTSLKKGTIKVITPDNTFREGTEVFYRNGKYYFLWSEDDTRSPNYKVRYATADSPFGPLNIPENNIVIQKDEEKQIYATGHNSVINVPETDQWYIVYHRFTRPKGIEMGRAAGFHREVSIDKMEFDKDGSIIEVEPSLKGIGPLE